MYNFGQKNIHQLIIFIKNFWHKVEKMQIYQIKCMKVYFLHLSSKESLNIRKILKNLHQNTLVKAFLRIDLSINFLPLVTIFLVEQKVRKLQKFKAMSEIVIQ